MSDRLDTQILFTLGSIQHTGHLHLAFRTPICIGSGYEYVYLFFTLITRIRNL